VDKKCFTICGGNNKKWYKAPLGLTPLVNSQSFKGRNQYGIGTKNIVRLSGSIKDWFNKMVEDSETLHLIAWFLISKPDLGGEVKWRLIADCRELKQHFNPSPFKLDHLQQIFPNLMQGHWAPRTCHISET
jgi:hypothetical protein